MNHGVLGGPSPVRLVPAPSARPSILALPRRGLHRAIRILRANASIISALATYLALTYLVVRYHATLLTHLETLATHTRSSGSLGIGLVAAIVFLTSIPPVPGYGTALTFSGYVYGFPLGYIPAFVGSLAGAAFVFAATRRFGLRIARRWMRGYQYMGAITRAVDERGWRLLVLIRLAPYPFAMMNGFLALCPTLTLRTFVLSTAVSLAKTIMHVVVGAGLESLHEHGALQLSNAEIAVVLAGFVLGVAIAVHVWRLAKQLVAEDAKRRVGLMGGGRRASTAREPN